MAEEGDSFSFGVVLWIGTELTMLAAVQLFIMEEDGGERGSGRTVRYEGGHQKKGEWKSAWMVMVYGAVLAESCRIMNMARPGPRVARTLGFPWDASICSRASTPSGCLCAFARGRVRV